MVTVAQLEAKQAARTIFVDNNLLKALLVADLGMIFVLIRHARKKAISPEDAL